MCDIHLGMYMHYSGRLVYVQSVSKEVEDPEVQVVTFTDLLDGSSWSLSAEGFTLPVPKDCDNPTAQRLTYEPVTRMDNTLSTATTDRLIEELRNRGDNPYQTVMSSDFKVFTDTFSFGSYSRVLNREGEYDIVFHPWTTFDANDLSTVVSNIEKYSREKSDLVLLRSTSVEVDLQKMHSLLYNACTESALKEYFIKE